MLKAVKPCRESVAVCILHVFLIQSFIALIRSLCSLSFSECCWPHRIIIGMCTLDFCRQLQTFSVHAVWLWMRGACVPGLPLVPARSEAMCGHTRGIQNGPGWGEGGVNWSEWKKPLVGISSRVLGWCSQEQHRLDAFFFFNPFFSLGVTCRARLICITCASVFPFSFKQFLCPLTSKELKHHFPLQLVMPEELSKHRFLRSINHKVLPAT